MGSESTSEDVTMSSLPSLMPPRMTLRKTSLDSPPWSSTPRVLEKRENDMREPVLPTAQLNFWRIRPQRQQAVTPMQESLPPKLVMQKSLPPKLVMQKSLPLKRVMQKSLPPKLAMQKSLPQSMPASLPPKNLPPKKLPAKKLRVKDTTNCKGPD